MSQMERHITTVTPLLKRFTPDRRNLAANLLLDIFVDNLSPYLQVEDIMALRRVNKYYFLLTHQPLIWKRYLKELRVLVPPIRPTLDYAAHATDHEFEQLVSRAISVEDNWRKQRPTIASYTFFDVGFEVSEMKLLPGGKYLVSLLKYGRGSFVTMNHLDYPSRTHLLAIRAIPAEASQLQAKYMTYQGKPVVMIAFITKETYRQPNTNPAQEGSGAQPQKVDVLNCFHVDLSALDSLVVAPQNPETTRRRVPIEETIRKGMKPLSLQVSLYSREGIAHVSVLQEAFTPDSEDRLLVLNLEHPSEPSYVICEFDLRLYRLTSILWVAMTRQIMKQSVRAVRHLPEQNDLLIWRTIRFGFYGYDKEEHRLELMEMPEHTGKRTILHSLPILSHVVFVGGKVDKVHITDDAWPYDGKTDIPLQASSQPPPPISIFVEMSSPQGIWHWHLWPTRGLTREGPRYVYHPNLETFKFQIPDHARPYTAHVLPGIFRSLIYTTEKSDVPGVSRSLVDLRRYISPQFQALSYRKRVKRHSTVERKGYRDVLSNKYTTFDVNPDVLSSYRTKGLGAIAWDHTIGRLCMTTAHGGVVQMIDFSYAAEPDDRFLFWKMASPGGFEHREDDQQTEGVD